MRRPTALLLVALLPACSDNPFTPSIEDIAGTYHLTTLVVRTPSDTTDYLAAGSTIDVTLNVNGTVMGSLHIVGGAEGGADLDADMAGTWLLLGTTVTFDQSADTFVRDVDFTATRDGRLVASWTDADATFSVALSPA